MDKIGQVLELETVKSAREAFEALRAAILDAYQDTRRQVTEQGYDPRIVQTAFAQFLHHNVQNRVLLLEGNHPDIRVRLIPNFGRGSHHIRVDIRNWIITISAVVNSYDRPRVARFRSDYALQWSFIFDDRNDLVIVPPLNIDKEPMNYIQVLHGPREDKRMYLGLMLIAEPDARGKYVRAPASFDAFLYNTFGPDTVDEETIDDSFDQLSLKQDQTTQEL